MAKEYTRVPNDDESNKDFAKNRKRKALANALRGRDASTGGKASGSPQAMNRNDKAADLAHDKYWNKRGVESDMTWTPNPSRTTDKKSKVQYGRGH